MLLTTTPSERIGRCTRMRRVFVRFNRSDSFVHARSSVGFTISTSGFEFFGTHRPARGCGRQPHQFSYDPIFLRPLGTVSSGYSARMMPMRGRMVSPPSAPQSPCAIITLALGQLGDVVGGVSQGRELAAARQRNRIIDGAVLPLVRDQSLIRFSTTKSSASRLALEWGALKRTCQYRRDGPRAGGARGPPESDDVTEVRISAWSIQPPARRGRCWCARFPVTRAQARIW